MNQVEVLTINPHELTVTKSLTDNQVAEILQQYAQLDGVVALRTSPRRVRHIAARNIVRLDVIAAT